MRRWAARIAWIVGAALAASLPAPGLAQPTRFADAEAERRLLVERSNLINAGRYEDAVPVAEAVLALSEKRRGADERATVDAAGVLAWQLRRTGEWGRAAEVFGRALASLEKTGDTETRLYRTTLRGLAGLYEEEGDRERAEPILLRLLTMAERDGGPYSSGVVDALIDLGRLRRDSGDPAGAEPLFLRALAAIRRSGAPVVVRSEDNDGPGRDASPAPLRGESSAALELGRTYAAMGDAARAGERLQEAQRLNEALGKSGEPELATVLDDLGRLRFSTGDLAGAEAALRRSLALRERVYGPAHPRVAVALHHLSFSRLAVGDSADAEALARRAVSILEASSGTEHRRTADARMDLALALALSGRAAEAIPIAARAADAQDRDARLVLATGSEAQKRAIAAGLAPSTDALISLHLDRAPADPGAARLALTAILRRKGRVLEAMASGFAALRRRLPVRGRALLERLSAVSTHLTARGALAGDAPLGAEDRARLDALAKERQQIEGEISALSGAFQAEEGVLTVDDVARALPGGAALAELIVYRPFQPGSRGAWGEPRYAAYVLGRDGSIAAKDLGATAPIDAAAARLLGALGDADLRHDPRPAARALDAVLFAPLRPLLGGAGAIFVSPDGPLNLVPLGALQDEQGRWLVERYDFTYLGAGRDLLRRDADEDARDPPTVFANPEFGALGGSGAASPSGLSSPRLGFMPLPGSAREASAVAAAVPGSRVLLGAAASEATLKAVRGPRVLHVASHGFFLAPPRPLAAPRGLALTLTPAELSAALSASSPLERSGIALAGANLGGAGGEDGILTALEASSLDLSGTKLAVLSACDTGVGEALRGEGVYGLRRALVMAGAETQVLSLWRIDTGATRALMEHLYAGLAEGKAPSEAMRAAELAMIADPATAHPNLWAGFIVSGRWSAERGGLGTVAKVAPGPRGCACELARGEGAPTAAIVALLLTVAIASRRARRCRLRVAPAGDRCRLAGDNGSRTAGKRAARGAEQFM